MEGGEWACEDRPAVFKPLLIDAHQGGAADLAQISSLRNVEHGRDVT